MASLFLMSDKYLSSTQQANEQYKMCNFKMSLLFNVFKTIHQSQDYSTNTNIYCFVSQPPTKQNEQTESKYPYPPKDCSVLLTSTTFQSRKQQHELQQVQPRRRPMR